MKEPVGVIPTLSRVLQYRPVAFKFSYNLLYKISLITWAHSFGRGLLQQL